MSRLAAFALALTFAPPVAAQQAPPASATAAVAEPAGLEEVDPGIINMVLLKINGQPILLSELRSRVNDQLELLRTQFPEEEIQERLPQLRRQMLEGMIDEMAMEHRAERLGIIVGPNEVDRWIQGIKDQNGFASDADLQAELQRIGMTMEDLREQGRKTIQQQRLALQEVQRSVFVTESEMREFYEENREQFGAPPQVRLEQLLFIGQGLQERAAAAAAELRAGADLATVAANYPEATAMEDKGTYIEVGDLAEGLAQAVPDLEVGVYSDPITMNFGLSVVKVVERTEEEVVAFEQVRDQIRNRLTSERSQERMEKYMAELRCETRIVPVDPRLGDLADSGCDEADEADEDN